MYFGTHWTSSVHKTCFFRFILDNPGVVEGQTVLDVGSGCGATAIAASMAGARTVIANDIDPCKVNNRLLCVLIPNVVSKVILLYSYM